DGVFHGRFGKDSAPVDFNRDWTPAPRRPEIAALAASLEAAAHLSPPALLLDLHASHHGDTSCYLFAGEDPASHRLSAFLASLPPWRPRGRARSASAAPMSAASRRRPVPPAPGGGTVTVPSPSASNSVTTWRSPAST